MPYQRKLAGAKLLQPATANLPSAFAFGIPSAFFRLPFGLAIKAWAGPEFWSGIGETAAAYAELTLGGVAHNIVVATLGNLVGGSLMVGTVYWFVYLRLRR